MVHLRRLSQQLIIEIEPASTNIARMERKDMSLSCRLLYCDGEIKK